MIHTILIIIFTCTVINMICGIYRINCHYKYLKELKIRAQHLDMCVCSIEHGICPHNCKVCAWGDVMTESQLNRKIELSPAEEKYYSNDVNEIMKEMQLDQENRIKRTKEFLKEIKRYHRRHKHD